MPQVNPNASFEVAVRHLFCHLDDAGALQRNPLVSRFFESQSNDWSTPAQQRVALEQIRWLILTGAKELRSVATTPDERARANRQVAIIQGCCIDKKSPAQLAVELGISVRQCYRERADTYRCLAEFIRSYEPTPWAFERTSEFQFQMDRASARIETGDHDRALREYKLIARSGDIRCKIEAFCKCAELELDLGKFSSATSSLLALTTMIATYAETLPDTAIDASRAHIQLLQARLAWATADFDRASRELALSRLISERFRESGDRRLKALRADILIESANRAIDRGDFLAAQEYLKQAGEPCHHDPALKLSSFDLLFAQITLNVGRIRPGGDVTLRQHLMLVQQAQEIAQQCGSMKRRLQAEALQVLLRDTREETPQTAERVLWIASQLSNRRLVATMSIFFADQLLQGPFWERAGSLLCNVLPKGGFAWGLQMHLKGIFNLKKGAPSEAWECEKLASQVAQNAGSPRMRAGTLRGLAMTAYRLAREDEAADYIVAAVPIAEQHGSAKSCFKTYRAAAFITGKSRYAKEAENLRIILNSSNSRGRSRH